MKRFAWSEEKHRQLREDRGISFESVVTHLEAGDLLAILEHPDPERFGRQRIYVVRIGAYAYLVPFVESEDEIFLKTVVPSRKATRDYLGSGRSKENKP